MVKLKSPVAEFTVVGKLRDFVIKDGDKIKYLRLIIVEREYWFKLSKEIRYSLDPAIQPGCWVEVTGAQKYKSGKLKLTASKVKLAANPQLGGTVSQPKAKASILVCQKADCCKRGGRAVYHAIEANLRSHELQDQVTIRATGCLKQCKSGPNVVFMPDKARYSNVHPAQIPALISEHFPD
ncbi:MAG: (2Fe-2S) ferredoxin domain-containing protein [Oscillatoria sp. PMC 1068.18]|nr:(2Fe-2S) ferredoxin domain-containing protein [Oscillatoria sp. PMC 1076.18]MEC4990327.1 (2Fe-2S) ferredoxin domain-containing protein [Oscillatoria sp. PMC 1068.18]